jgi:hypothetical protein
MLILLVAGIAAGVAAAVTVAARASRRRVVAATMSRAWIAEHVETDGKTGHGF